MLAGQLTLFPIYTTAFFMWVSALEVRSSLTLFCYVTVSAKAGSAAAAAV